MHFWDRHKTITCYYEILMASVCEKYDLRKLEYDILLFLYHNPKYHTAADIVRIRKSTKSHVSTALKVLEEKGFIIRTRSPQNAKRVLLYTTEKGKAFSYAHKRFDALNVSISMQRLLQSCSMEEVDAFYKVMDAYCDLFLKYGVEGIIPED